ncbi:MAG: hypothetical protein WCW31_03555 [Patescibacteria group bacterium]|jgi:hypothetical protein
MDPKENDPSHPFCPVIELAIIRRELALTVLPVKLVIVIRINMVNVYLDEAKAYRLAGLPVPTQVLEDAERWERENHS